MVPSQSRRSVYNHEIPDYPVESSEIAEDSIIQAEFHDTIETLDFDIDTPVTLIEAKKIMGEEVHARFK